MKSFWDRPEGKVGIGFLTAIGSGLAFLLWKLLPILITFATNLVVLAGLGVALAALLWVLFDDQFRTNIFYFYKILMRGFTGFLIELDPISIMKTYVVNLKKRLDRMREKKSVLSGEIRKLKTLMDDRTKEMNEAIAYVKQAKTERNVVQLRKFGSRVGMLEESLARLKQLYEKLEVLARVINKMYDVTSNEVEETEFRITHEESEFNATRSAHSAFKDAVSIMSGNSEEARLFQETLDRMRDQNDMKMAEIDTFMELSDNFLQSYDLKQGVLEKKGLQMLEEWEKKAESLLLGSDTKQTLLAKAYGDEEFDPDSLDTPDVQKTLGQNSYGKLIQ